jgi:hypothetical protein
MALFGEKCHRCGNRTRNKEDDKAVCGSCVEEMKLMLEASQEASMLCPADGATMKKEVAHMLVIDRCPNCSGVWLDGGELERLRNGVENDALMLMARGISYPI